MSVSKSDAKHLHKSVIHGNYFPIDVDSDEDYSTKRGTHWGLIAARAVTHIIQDRFGGVFDDIDQELREDLICELAKVISQTEINREELSDTDFNKLRKEE